MRRTGINIVEHESIALAGIRFTMKGTRDLEAAGGWSSLSEARLNARSIAPATYLVDVATTGGPNPLAALADLACAGHAVLVRAPTADVDLVQAVLETGARGIVERSAEARETLGALRLVAAGARYVPTASRRPLQLRLLSGKRSLLGAITPREWEIVEHISAGRSAPETAQTLSVTLPTVRTHLSRVYAKLDVANNVGALARLFELGLLRPPAAPATRDGGPSPEAPAPWSGSAEPFAGIQ